MSTRLRGYAMPNKILVVDDEPVQRRLLEATLSKLGFDPQCVENGMQAIEALESKNGHRFKAVILDLVMPEMDGMAVLENRLGERKSAYDAAEVSGQKVVVQKSRDTERDVEL